MSTTLTVRRVYNVTVTIPETLTDDAVALAAARPAIDAAVIAATHAGADSDDIVLEEIDELVSA